MSTFGLTAGLLVPVGIVALFVRPFGAVSRVRLERFARRQSLVITPTNGPRVISYLATTRRWRSSGILVALAVSEIEASITGRSYQLDWLTVFAGWFVGAVAAEWRVGSGRRDGVRRSASLVPRRIGDYLSAGVRVLTGIALLTVVAVEITLVALAKTERPLLAAWLGATLIVTLGIALVARHVLTRPQPLDQIDVELADQALRSRSLHVLLGSVLAIAGYLSSGAANVASRDYLWGNAQWPSGAIAIGSILLPALGVMIATSTFTARPRRNVHVAVV